MIFFLIADEFLDDEWAQSIYYNIDYKQIVNREVIPTALRLGISNYLPHSQSRAQIKYAQSQGTISSHLEYGIGRVDHSLFSRRRFEIVGEAKERIRIDQ